MITEDYTSYEVAKLLKDKGFDGKVSAYYHIWDNGSYVCTALEFMHSEAPHLYIPAPTLQMTMKWLRKVHNIFYVVYPKRTDNKIVWKIDICNLIIDSQRWHLKNELDTYEEAVEVALKYVLENLI